MMRRGGEESSPSAQGEEVDDQCIDVYCRLAASISGYNDGTDNSAKSHCPYREQIVVEQRNAKLSRGPLVARHRLQNLLLKTMQNENLVLGGGEESFCLGIDGHSIFTNDWDRFLVRDWIAAENEMAVITTYVHDGVVGGPLKQNGDNSPYPEVPHLCDVKVGGHGIPRNEGATNIYNATRPILQSKWGAGFSFSKCHTEERVRIDSHTDWVFDGEEFSRAALLWMSGYDFYSPTVYGQAVYHNYTGNSVITSWNSNPSPKKDEEVEMGHNRVKLHVGQPFEGKVSTIDFDRYSPQRKARSLEQFLNFCGIGSYENTSNWTHVCHQLHFVPYERPEVVEAMIPGWRQVDSATGTSDRSTSKNKEKMPPECMYQGTCDETSKCTDYESNGAVNFVQMETKTMILILILLVVLRRRR